MASTNDATVNAFYLAYYGRPADPAGLAYWSQALATSNGDFSSIISAFSTSSEATARIGTGTATDQISNVYQQLFGHAPDAAGLAYWTNAISSGNMTLAEAAIQITQGAQTSDLTVSTLRLDVAAQFTAAVAASGVAYDGDASVAAARAMISAVNANSSANDIQSLITAGASLAQTAHDNPAIISAMANGGDLSTLLSTASGQSNPVALIQALASIGKAALTDSAGLTTLLHGGGVAGLLASLPAGTTITDVAAAVDKGGLSAGTTVATTPVVTTPTDTTPPAAPIVKLVADTGFNTADGITGNGKIAISGLESGSTWQYSNDSGKTWITGPAATNGSAILQTTGFGGHSLDVRSIDKAGNISASSHLSYDLEATFAFEGPNGTDLPVTTLHTNTNDFGVIVHGGAIAAHVEAQVSETGTGDWVDLPDTLADGTHYLRYILTDSAGHTSTSNTLTVVMDQTQASAVSLALDNDTGNLDDDNYTSDGHVNVTITDPNAVWTYSTDNGYSWTVGSNATKSLLTTGEGADSVLVRTYDTVDGVTTFTTATLNYTLDTIAPAYDLKLASVQGAADGSTITPLTKADVTFSYTSPIDIAHGDALFYSVNGGEFVRADASMINTTTHTITIPQVDVSNGPTKIEIQTKDAAGNLSDQTFSVNSAPLTPTLAFVGIDGKDLPAGTTLVTNSTYYYVDLKGVPTDGTALFQYSTTGNAGDWHTQTKGTLLPDGNYFIRFSVTDPAGDSGYSNTLNLTMDSTVKSPTLKLVVNSGSTTDTITNNGHVLISGLTPGEKWAYSYDNTTWTTGVTGADGTATIANVNADGLQALQVRTIETVNGHSVFTNPYLPYTLDTTAPATPTVALVYDSGSSQTDTITSNGNVTISGLEKNATFDYSLDGGKTWVPSNIYSNNSGTAAMQTAVGEHTLLIRAYDIAGNVSANSASLHYTVAAPLNVTFDHIEGGATGSFETTQSKADVVFKYTGDFVGSDTLSYYLDQTKVTISANNIDPNDKAITIDAATHTITLHDIDLTTSNPYVGITSSNAAGDSSGYAGGYISGPYSVFYEFGEAADFEVGAHLSGKHIYLTDNGKSVDIGVTESVQITSIGAQDSVVKGMLGVGIDADHQTFNNESAVYVLGTTGADTVTGSNVWGFDGDDNITVVGDSNNQAAVSGGAGADVIHAGGAKVFFGYADASDSSIVTDTDNTVAAHGFDQVYVGGTSATTDFFNFEGMDLKSATAIVAHPSTPLTGDESGSALLALINAAVGDTFSAHTDVQQAAIIDFGMGTQGEVNYLVADTNLNGQIDAGDYVVQIIGTVSAIHLSGTGQVSLDVPSAA